MNILIGVLFLLVISVLSFLLYESKKRNKILNEKYSGVEDVDIKISKSIGELKKIHKQIGEVKINYKDKLNIYNKLKREIAIYDAEIELQELGFYKPQYDFDTSEKYKEELSSIKQDQKRMLSNKTAIICTQEWVVEGSKTKGQTMTNRNIRLISRAFNNECDALIAKVTWNNAEKAKERIRKAYDAINKLSESMAIHIDRDYFYLKIKELELTYEYKEKKQREKEEQAEIRQQMREEARLEQEIQKAQQEEDKYEKLLEKAKQDAEKVTGDKLDKLKEKMALLEDELAQAHSKNERAKSMAEQTRAGHVYVISNVGSFGENIYKIGMTRRLEPIDRVKELGDASVPFIFDIHAMIYSEDAPALEKTLHRAFNERRLNLVNNRKEFFNVSLDEIEAETIMHKNNAVFTKTIEAREYKESLMIRSKVEHIEEKSIFPDSI